MEFDTTIAEVDKEDALELAEEAIETTLVPCKNNEHKQKQSNS